MVNGSAQRSRGTTSAIGKAAGRFNETNDGFEPVAAAEIGHDKGPRAAHAFRVRFHFRQ